jgi:hypothetical protein
MAAKYETGSYTNKGFLSTDPLGFCARLDDWLTSAPGVGGAGWTLIDDHATVLSATFTISGAPWYCYSVGHGLFTGQEVNVLCPSGYPTGLSANNTFFAIRIDPDNFGLATTLTNALAGTNIISSTGSGTRTFYSSPFRVYCNVPAPLLNQSVKFLRVLYNSNITATGFTDAVRLMGCLWWDTTNHIPRGIWHQYYISVRASISDSYFFVGNDQYIVIVSKNNTTYNQYVTGTWVGDSNLIEPITAIGSLQSGITAGSSVVCTLLSGQASNFTANKYYFIYDFDGHSWVDYVRCSAVDTGLDTVTLQTVGYNFPAGSVIGAYPHRFYSMGTNVVTSGTANNADNMTHSRSSIPYVSSTSGVPSNVFHNQTSRIRPSCRINFHTSALAGGDPEDGGYYYSQIPIISEYERGDGTVDTTGLRVYGKVGTGDLYVTSVTGLTQAVTLRAVSGVNCVYYNTSDNQFTVGGDSGTAVLIQAQST